MSTETKVAYSIIDAGYTQSAIGDIVDTGSGTTVQKTRVSTTDLDNNTDPTVYWFTNGGNPRVLVARYEFGTLKAFKIFDVSGSTWVQIGSDKTWGSIANIYGVTTYESGATKYLYVIDYDSAIIGRIDMSGTESTSYTLDATYTFPTISGYPSHGVAIATVGSNIYGLFMSVDDPWDPSPTYLNSTVVKLAYNFPTFPATPPISDPATYLGPHSTGTSGAAGVGKNAFTLVPSGSNLYVCSIGGKQEAGAANINTNSTLDIVTLGMGGALPGSAVTALVVTNSAGTDPYEFRDIVFDGSGNANILVGYYDTGYASLIGGVYQIAQTALDLLSSALLSAEASGFSPVDQYGFIWSLMYAANPAAYWFVRGNDIARYDDILDVPTDEFVPADLGEDDIDVNLNSATLGAVDVVPLMGKSVKGYQPHAFASRTPRAAAEKARILDLAQASRKK